VLSFPPGPRGVQGCCKVILVLIFYREGHRVDEERKVKMNFLGYFAVHFSIFDIKARLCNSHIGEYNILQILFYII